MGKNRDAGSQSEGALFLSSRQRRPGIAVRDERADQRCCGGEQKHAAVPAVQKIDGMGRQMTRDEHEAMEECAAIIQFCSGREIGRVDAWQIAYQLIFTIVRGFAIYVSYCLDCRSALVWVIDGQ